MDSWHLLTMGILRPKYSGPDTLVPGTAELSRSSAVFLRLMICKAGSSSL